MLRKTGTARADATTPSGHTVADVAVPCKVSLQFVNLTDTAVLNASARKFVRSHVMKEFEQRSAVRNLGAGSKDPISAWKPMRNVDRSIHTWDPGLLGSGTVDGMRDSDEGPRLAGSVASSTDTRSSESGATIEYVNSEESAEVRGSREKLMQTDVQQRLRPYKSWNLEDAEISNPSSISLAGYRTSCGDKVGQGVDLDFLLSPPVYRLGVGNGRLDPFETLPFSSPRSQVLFSHFLSQITVASLIMSARKHWFLLSLTDKAFFLIALSHAAAHLSRSQQKRTWNASEALQLRTEAIRLINERIWNTDERGPTDGTIGAVASILTYEASHFSDSDRLANEWRLTMWKLKATNGSPFAIHAHMTGLAQMISLRGGIVTAGFSNILVRLILRADLSTANVLGTSPVFPLLSDCDPSTPSPGPFFPILDQDISIETRDTAQFLLLPPPLRAAFHELRYLIKILDISEIPGALLGLHNSDTLWFSDRVYVVQRTLMELAAEYASLASQTNQELEQPLGNPGVAGTAAIASLIFVECILRDTAPKARIIKILLSRLVLAIERTHVLETAIRGLRLASSPFEIDEAQGLLRITAWICGVGGIAASEDGVSPGHRGWWVQLLTVTATNLMGSGGGSAHQALKSVVWPKEATGVGSKLWMNRCQDLLTCCECDLSD